MTTLIATLVLGLQSGSPASYVPKGPQITFVMESGGNFTITTDPKHSPKTVAHIVDLVRKGFYNRQRIHRVEKWVTQWGAPASKDEPLDIKGPDGKMDLNPHIGDGGSGKQLPFEGNREVDFYRGVVGVASEGLQVGGDSQLFILKKDYLRLFNSYAVVGKVTQGMNAVDAIKRGDRITKAFVVGDKQPPAKAPVKPKVAATPRP